MYIPKYFKINDEEVIYNFIEENGFATVFSQHNGGPYATHLPLILDRTKRELYGHFAKPNHQWKDIENQEVLIIFQGPHCYISPSWYETQDAVPTWNYVSIHVYGNMEMIMDEQEIMDALSDLVVKYELPESPYKLEDVDSNYMSGLSKGIVPFKIKINRIEGKWKLSQNHSEERQKLVIQQLEKIPSENQKQIAKLMKENLACKKL
ncbi:FMN-binding negative transcriptional regulator [Peribacillus alkalitolerans]|uniref:FMN-binding negative transcriptional regulator n=1 Tax=Peribacillus alkalitolerans TaxID=1550385 RepID=UPI0013D359F3|nr:FMN-binding negative transcriptional regulator [Peribacillus alkalitolerans]